MEIWLAALNNLDAKNWACICQALAEEGIECWTSWKIPIENYKNPENVWKEWETHLKTSMAMKPEIQWTLCSDIQTITYYEIEVKMETKDIDFNRIITEGVKQELQIQQYSDNRQSGVSPFQQRPTTSSQCHKIQQHCKDPSKGRRGDCRER